MRGDREEEMGITCTKEHQHATLVMPCPLDYDHIAPLLLSEAELRMNSFDNNAP